jgi:hypothetical protein
MVVESENTPPPIFYTFSPAEEHLSMSAVGISSGRDDLTLPERQVARILADVLGQIPEVVSICGRFGEDDITIWTLLKFYDRDAREMVYKRELEICRDLQIYDFDFRTTSVSLVNPGELIDSGLRQIFKRA